MCTLCACFLRAAPLQVQQALQEAAKERSVLIIAHRLSTVSGADMVAVVQAGRVIESGTHSQLMSQPGGAYAQLVQRQVFASAGGEGGREAAAGGSIGISAAEDVAQQQQQQQDEGGLDTSSGAAGLFIGSGNGLGHDAGGMASTAIHTSVNGSQADDEGPSSPTSVPAEANDGADSGGDSRGKRGGRGRRKR
jgi:hypothetical protein